MNQRPATALRETGGPTTLAVKAIPDGQLGGRSGSDFKGVVATTRVLYPTWPRTLTEDVTIPSNHSAVVAGPFALSTFNLIIGADAVFRVF